MDLAIPAGYVDITETLPSKGRFYTGRLYARPYSFAETASVSERMSLEAKDEVNAYRHVLEGMMFNDGSPVGQLFVGDFLFATFYRKVMTAGGKKFFLRDISEGWDSMPITIDMINFRDLEAPELPVRAMICEDWVEFEPLRIEDWLTYMTENGAHPNLAAITRMMSKGKVEAQDIIDPMDVETLGEVVGLLSHGIDPVDIEVKRQGGDETRTVRVDLDSSQSTIVLPFRGPGEARRNPIRFGDASRDPAE